MASIIKLDFNITNRCNFRCHHCCFASGEKIGSELSLVKISGILKEFRALGGRRIDITGGEPLLRADVENIIYSGKNLGLKVEINSNGLLADSKRLKILKKAGLDDIAVSLDGPDFETYHQVRPVKKETFNKIIKNIQTCVELGFPTKINTVAFNLNLKKIPAITNLCLDWRVYEHGIYYFTPIGRGSGFVQEVIEPTTWLKFIRHSLSLYKDKIKLSVETPILEKSFAQKIEKDCYLKSPWHLQILSDGKVYPCAVAASKGIACGNLHQQSLSKIWQSPFLQNQICFSKFAVPLLNQFGACFNFGNTFKKQIMSKEYCFICPMRKYKVENFYD